MRPMRGPDAATIRAWARATGRPVGARGAIPAHLQNAYVVAQVTDRLRRAGLAAARIALSVGAGRRPSHRQSQDSPGALRTRAI